MFFLLLLMMYLDEVNIEKVASMKVCAETEYKYKQSDSRHIITASEFYIKQTFWSLTNKSVSYIRKDIHKYIIAIDTYGRFPSFILGIKFGRGMNKGKREFMNDQVCSSNRK